LGETHRHARHRNSKTFHDSSKDGTKEKRQQQTHSIVDSGEAVNASLQRMNSFVQLIQSARQVGERLKFQTHNKYAQN